MINSVINEWRDTMVYGEYLDNVKKMIDDLKAMTADLGLGNAPEEYNIITVLFTYKFLNDKLLHSFEHREDKSETFEDFVDYADSKTAKIEEKYLLTNLFQKQNEKNFHKIFDDALKSISDLNKDVYSIETSTGVKKPLMEPMSVYLRDVDKEKELAKRAINILCKYKFENIYGKGWDYFSSIFEYLIKDYNNNSSKYAEYYTPASAGAIMADILYDDTPVDKVTLYDPAAGSGTLLMSMADKIGIKNCTLYSQDRSQKSTQFLRINLILNNLAHSLANVVEGNTLTAPAHLQGDKLKQFDFIVSNPPFNVDFSADVETLKADRYNRFFAGIPNIPNKDLKKMAIYLPFLQHILSSLGPNGKAAIVVPNGFLTAGASIPLKIRKEIVDNYWLKGVIQMPGNIFATTGTNVSIVFIDKTQPEDTPVILIDASELGEKVKLEDGQRTILLPDDERLIIDTFKKKENIEKFSIKVSTEDIKEKKYSFSAGQYFAVAIDYDEITEKEFIERVTGYKTTLGRLFKERTSLETELMKQLEELLYD